MSIEPRHPDAIGYLNDLAQEVGEEWFTMICDLASIGDTYTLDEHNTDILFALFEKTASYIGINPAIPSGTTSAEVSPTDFLETLRFSNFKLLRDTLQFELTNRITVIFGANGSGKSSVCEALKILASPNAPIRPLQNVRADDVIAPATFSFKFRNDTALQSWTQANGYGLRSSTIKYFDTGIALKNIEGAVEPGRIIVLTPFKLHVFEWTKELTTRFRDVLRQASERNAEKIAQAIEAIRIDFKDFNDYPLASIDEGDLSVLSRAINNAITVGTVFDQHKLLKAKQLVASELQKALSEEGLRLLRAEYNQLKSFLISLKILLDSAESLWMLEPINKAKELKAKKTAQEVLAQSLIPNNGTLEGLMELLRTASPLCNLEAAEHEVCPLCKQQLGEDEVRLFKLYHELLVGELEEEILKLQSVLLVAKNYVTEVHSVKIQDWDLDSILPSEMFSKAKTEAEFIVGNCNLTQEPSDEAYSAVASLRILYTEAEQFLINKANAIKGATNSREDLLKQFKILSEEIKALRYEQQIEARLIELNELQRMVAKAKFWNEKLSSFTPLFRKITDTAKTAYEQLVVSDFEARLDAEYRALTEKPMSVFGVNLVKRGSDASVTVLPQIGGKAIEGVLSEGEQRVHALALFFAELETCQQTVIVFDDPISSFDYNYIANYCIRLRDFAMTHPNHQIIVLTHNWEFFVQLQITLNQAELNNQLSVQVLENCAIIADYSEKVDELKNDISEILALSAEPTRTQKEEMAGKMRRLIETVVNSYVFNNQRHQYKQKSQPVSNFNQYTKLVPLLPSEATTLRDLYAKLSISEHDDPRNAYVNTDKATFQSRFGRILDVANAIQSRRTS